MPLTPRHILCDSSSSQAQGLDATGLSAMKIACQDSLDPLFQNLGIWIQGSGATGHVSSATYFSNLLEDKDRRLKIKLTLSVILRVNLRLGGYSI
jgi:hypothetical protein